MTSEKSTFGGENVSVLPDAITTDFEKLLTKFTNTKSVRYEWFLQIWKEMSMSLFYAGQQNDRECREFTEECLKVASAYILPPYQFQVRVCGLYLLYALYFRHPFEPRVKIRITLSEWKELLSFINEIRQQQHLDVEYVFTRLRHDRAFHFVANKTELYPGIRGLNDALLEAQQQKVDMIVEQTSAISNIFQSDVIEELSAIHEEYHRHKCFLSGLNATQPDPSFNIINPFLVHDITKAVASHENWRKSKGGKKVGGRRRRDSGHTTSESEGESEVEQFVSAQAKPTKSVGAIRAEIKARAFTSTLQATQSRRHRQAHKVSPSDAPVYTSPKKRGRKRLSSGNQNALTSEQMMTSPTIAEEKNVTEVSAFGSFLNVQPDENGVFSMPNFLDESPAKETKKRQNPKSASPTKVKRTINEKSGKKIKQSLSDKEKQKKQQTPKKQMLSPEGVKKRGRPPKNASSEPKKRKAGKASSNNDKKQKIKIPLKKSKKRQDSADTSE